MQFFTRWKLSDSFRAQLNETVWLSVLFAVTGALIALRYLTGLPNAQWWQSVYAFLAACGVCFVGHLLLQAVLVLPWTRFNSKWRRAVAFLLTLSLLVALVTDTFVYQQYRFHINWPMIDLALVGGREVFSFSTGMWLRIALLISCLAGVASLLVWIASKLQGRSRAVWWCLAILVGYVAVNGINAYSVSQNVRSVTVLTERLPLYYPVRANRFLAKFGLVAVEEERLHLTDKYNSFRYPLNPVYYDKNKNLNVLILAIDSLRADVVDPKTMPNVSELKEQAITFLDHYSAGNATRSGVFGLFYGLPPFYWQSALSSNVPPAMITGFQQAGYEISAFTTATLLRPEFYATVFSSVRPLRMGSEKGRSVIERDVESIDDFEKWIEGRDSKKPFMSFMFLDSVHAVSFPKDLDVPYKNYWEEVSQIDLGPEFDPLPYFNSYRNSAFWADVMIDRVVQILKKNNLLGNTILIITSDHGDEFNDSGLNYWGHNGNFSQAQIKIPLVVLWPGLEPREITYRTTAYDVSTTLIKRVLQAKNEEEDFGVGSDLFDSSPREVFFSGSYSEDAIVAGEEVLLIKASGAMEARSLKNWHEIEDASVKKWVPHYLQIRGKYRQ